MKRTVLAVFDRTEKAELAVDALASAGVSRHRVALSPAVNAEANRLEDDDTEAALPVAAQAFLAGVEAADDGRNDCARAMLLGWTVLKVEAEDNQAAAASRLLKQAGAVKQVPARPARDHDRDPKRS